MISDLPAATHIAPTLAHASASFEFLIAAPLDRAAPLFGPEGERAWAGKDWDPVFLYPAHPRDIEGAVFTVAHGSHSSVWVNTCFDVAAGRMQYVMFVPGAMTSIVDVALRPDGNQTRARVTYRRTALTAEANDHVIALSRADGQKGPEWHDAIAAMLVKGTQ